MLKNLIHKKYILYGSSIILTKGLEILLLFYAAHHFSKADYGSLEYYKKVIEVGAGFFAFGFPALILSYTKSQNSKIYFYFLSILFVLVLGLVSLPFLSFFQWGILLIPFVFYASFFTGGITQSYFLVSKGSNWASTYKISISILFYSLVFVLIYFYQEAQYAFVYPSYFLLPILLLWWASEWKKRKVHLHKIKKYWRLFSRLLGKSFTLVVSNFADLMFLYTDIFIIKIMSEHAYTDIANYSFALNFGNMLMLIPLTLIQVDIEKLKKSTDYIKVLHKKILILLILSVLVLVIVYGGIIQTIFTKYQETFVLFLIILFAKFFQALSPLYGTYLLIARKFKENLLINISMLLLNIILNYFMYYHFGLYGIASASVISLFIRYVVLLRLNKIILKQK